MRALSYLSLCQLLSFWLILAKRTVAYPQEPDIGLFTFRPPSGAGDDDSSSIGNTSADESESEASIVSSSLLYDGGCIVSAQAIMCEGGYQDMLQNSGADLDAEDSDEDEEDDDDDNDGHSSMLSNASLRRKVLLGGSTSASSDASYSEKQQSSSSRSSRSAVSSTTKPFSASKRSSRRGQVSAASQTALSIRGGGVAADLGAEFAKKLLVTALVTLVFEGCIGHILEFVKIVMQTSPDGTSYTEVIKKITSQKGIGGLWDGFVPWGVTQSIFKGAVFGLAHAVASSALVPLAEQGTIPMQLAKTIAGGIGGGFQGFVLSPTLLLKTRVMTNEIFREKMSMPKTTWLSLTIGYDVVSSEGIGALMKGSGIFATKRVCDWASRYYFSDLFENMAKNYKGGAALTVTEKSVCSLLGGTFSTIVTLPLDVLVAKIQDAKKAGVRVSAWTLFRNELKEKGWVGLKNSYMNGFEARLVHVALTTVAIKTGTPIAYDLLFPSKETTEAQV